MFNRIRKFPRRVWRGLRSIYRYPKIIFCWFGIHKDLAWNTLYAEKIRLTCQRCNREKWIEYRTAELGVIASSLLYRDGYICQEMHEDGELILTVKYSRREAIKTSQQFLKIANRLCKVMKSSKDVQKENLETNEQN